MSLKPYTYTNSHGHTFTLTLDQIDVILYLNKGIRTETVVEVMSLIGMEKEALAWQANRKKTFIRRRELGRFQCDLAYKEGKTSLFDVALAGTDTNEYKELNADLDALREEEYSLWNPIEQAMNGVREVCLSKTDDKYITGYITAGCVTVGSKNEEGKFVPRIYSGEPLTLEQCEALFTEIQAESGRSFNTLGFRYSVCRRGEGGRCYLSIQYRYDHTDNTLNYYVSYNE